jgi:hypothetical protein
MKLFDDDGEGDVSILTVISLVYIFFVINAVQLKEFQNSIARLCPYHPMSPETTNEFVDSISTYQDVVDIYV